MLSAHHGLKAVHPSILPTQSAVQYRYPDYDSLLNLVYMRSYLPGCPLIHHA